MVSQRLRRREHEDTTTTTPLPKQQLQQTTTTTTINADGNKININERWRSTSHGRSNEYLHAKMAPCTPESTPCTTGPASLL
jgi:hypothetical protein